MDSFEVDDYEDDWRDKDEEHGGEDYPESVQFFPFLLPLFLVSVIRGGLVIAFMEFE